MIFLKHLNGIFSRGQLLPYGRDLSFLGYNGTPLALLTFLWLGKRYKHLLLSLCETLCPRKGEKSARSCP